MEIFRKRKEKEFDDILFRMKSREIVVVIARSNKDIVLWGGPLNAVNADSKINQITIDACVYYNKSEIISFSKL